ncbi:hypothetical protein L1887_16266 [Cichorium endivia]|nr:hypothetical protein L1887_16266 [Cichorium endivia]
MVRRALLCCAYPSKYNRRRPEETELLWNHHSRRWSILDSFFPEGTRQKQIVRVLDRSILYINLSDFLSSISLRP